MPKPAGGYELSSLHVFRERDMCTMHAQQPANVQDARGKFAQKFAHEGR
jgi:hypothetical protein